uniref:Integrase SSV1 C-terminal domain-containing protein n=2 Tax=Geoglobus ahangari TaxID=113653 RepID=A0A7C3YLY6_9EURY
MKNGLKTAEKYIKAIDSYLPEGIKEPKDIGNIIRSKATAKGLRNFLNFLEDQYYLTELGGYNFDLWRKHMPIKPAYERKKTIFLTNEDIAEAHELIKEKWKDEATEILFKLITFSGIRYEHAYRMLKTFDKRKLIIENDIAYYPIEELTKGKKKGYFAFMPAEFAKKLRKFDDLLNEESYKNRLQPSRWKPPRDNPVSVIRIRSWFQNFAIDNGLRTEAVRFIVGHSPASVGEAHYYNMLKIAKDEYRKIVDKFPIPP